MGEAASRANGGVPDERSAEYHWRRLREVEAQIEALPPQGRWLVLKYRRAVELCGRSDACYRFLEEFVSDIRDAFAAFSRTLVGDGKHASHASHEGEQAGWAKQG